MPTIVENLKDMVGEVTQGAAEAGENMAKQTTALVRKQPAKAPQPLIAPAKKR